MMDVGVYEGETCSRAGCKGIIDRHPSEGCSCHINPPCSACTAPRMFCPVCGWEEKDDVVFNDYVVQVDPKTHVFKSWTPRPLDNTKIDWRTETHTHFTQKCVGVYPEGTTSQEVLEKVKGTFGGRFEQFGGGRFVYVAYTD